MERTRTRRCSIARWWPTALRISSRAATGGASTVAGCATTTTTVATALTRVRTATLNIRRARRVSSLVRTSSASGTRTGAMARTIAVTTRTSSDVRRVAGTDRRLRAALTSFGAPAGSASMLRWCATKCQIARTTVTSQPTATWTSAPGSSSISAPIGASIPPLGSRASAMRDTSQSNLFIVFNHFHSHK